MIKCLLPAAALVCLAAAGSIPRPAASILQGLSAPTLRIAGVAPASEQPFGVETIFHDEFTRPPDPAVYWEVDGRGGSFAHDAAGGLAGGAMRSTFAKGQVSAGALHLLFGRNPFNRGLRRGETFKEVFWRVYVKHEAGWEGNPAKLARATCMAGEDWSQGLIAHVWGGKGDTLCIDPASGIRDGRKVSVKYNDFDHLRWLGLRNGTTPLFSPAESGRWVCVESRVKVNTPGRADGEFQLWVDGRLEAERRDLDWHGTWDEYGVNALFIENYWNSGSVKRQSRWFDNLVVSTKPIGPVVASEAPLVTRTEGAVEGWQAEASTAPDESGRLVWQSPPLPGTATSVTVDTRHGTFRSVTRLEPGRTYWLRVREKGAGGEWSDWSAWHAPFKPRG